MPALSVVNEAVTPVEPLTALIASLIAVTSDVEVIVAVTVEAVSLLPRNVKVYVATEAKAIFKKVKVFKPKSSRKDSKESFIICKNLR